MPHSKYTSRWICDNERKWLNSQSETPLLNALINPHVEI